MNNLAPYTQFQAQLRAIGRDRANPWAIIKVNNRKIFAYNSDSDDLYRLKTRKAETGENYASEDDQRARFENGCLKYYFDKCLSQGFGYGGFEKLRELASQDNELFLIPNYIPLDPSGENGIGADFVAFTSTLFVEIDDRAIDQQWDKIKEISSDLGLEASLVVFSGGKSLHIYFKLQEPLTDLSHWKRLQQKLICLLSSDPAIANPNREMRVAGVDRKSKNSFQSLELERDRAYSAEEIEANLDASGLFPYGMDDERFRLYRKEGQSALLKAPEEINPPRPAREANFKPVLNGDAVPLEKCLTRDDQELINNGASSERNNQGLKLAKNLIATAERLAQLGHNYEGNPYDLFIEYCQRCVGGRGWNQREWDLIWRSAQSGNPTPSLPDETLESRIAYWQWEKAGFPKSESKWEEPDPDLYRQFEEEQAEEEVRAEAEKERDREIWRENFPVAAKNRYNKNKQFTPDRTINTPRLEDGDIPDIYEVERIFGLRSGLGTGKTEAIKRLAQAYPDEGFLMLLHRNTLGIQSAERLGFTHLRSNDYDYQQGKSNVSSQQLIEDTSSRLILCFDSLYRFAKEDFNNRRLVIDEATAGVLHLLTSATAVKDRLEEVLELFKEALQRAKQVIVLDGMLNNATIDYLHQLAPNKTPVKVLNTCQNPIEITNLTGTWEQTEEELLDKVNKNDRVPWLQLMKESAVPALFTDSQVFAEAMEKQFQKNGMDGIRVDSTTVGEDYAKTFLNNPDAYIEQYQPDYVICSPSAESGTDISIRNYFTAQFNFFFGAIGTNAQHQMMFRIRDEQMPRYLWVKEFSKTTEDWRSPFPKTTMRNYRDMLWQDIENCFAAGEDVTEKLKALTEMSQDNPHDKMLSTLQSIDHYEKGNLRECLLESLESAGHSITSKLPEKVRDKTETELKDEVKDQRAEDIYQAQDIDDETLEDYRQSGKYEKLVCAWKALLLKKLPGIEETEFWNPELIRALKFEQSDWIRQLERRWMLYNPEQAQLLQRKKWHKALNGYIGKYQIRSDYSKTKALREAGIQQFINAETGMEWHQDSPEVQEFLEECKKHIFKTQFGAKPGRKTRAISWLSRCLEVFGYRLKERRQQENGERIRYYRLDQLPPEDNILYQCIEERLSKVAHQTREEEAGQEQNETRNENKGETPSQQGFNQWPARPYEYIYNNGHAGHFDINQKESKSTPVGLTEIVGNLDWYYEGYALEFAPEILNELRANSERAEGQKERYCSKHLSLKSEKADEIKEALLSIQSKTDLNFFKENMPYANLSNRVWRDLLTQEQREAIQQIKNGTGEPDNVAYGDFEKSHTTDVSDRAGSNSSETPVNDDCRRQATSLHRTQENLFPVEVGDYITIQHSVAKPSTLKVVSVEIEGNHQKIRYDQPGWHMNPSLILDSDVVSISNSEGDIKWQRDRQLVSSA